MNSKLFGNQKSGICKFQWMFANYLFELDIVCLSLECFKFSFILFDYVTIELVKVAILSCDFQFTINY